MALHNDGQGSHTRKSGRGTELLEPQIADFLVKGDERNR